MAKKKRSFNIRLTDEQFTNLTGLANSYHVSKTQLIEAFTALRYPPSQPSEDIQDLITELRYIGNNLNQIAFIANNTKLINYEEYKINVDILYSVILDIKEAVAQPSAYLQVNIKND